MKFILFIDECGDHSLVKIDPCFPIFLLCGVLISETDYKTFCKGLNILKSKYWQSDKKIIFHSRDIRKCQKGFEILFDLDLKKSFYYELNNLIENTDFKIITTSILKEEYIKKYGKMNDVYAVSLSSIIENTIFFVDDLNLDANFDILVERRGEREDKNLLKYYNELTNLGTYYITSHKIKKIISSFQFKWKKENIEGLQLADLIAYPVANYVLDNSAINLAYDIIKNKIIVKNNLNIGITVFP